MKIEIRKKRIEKLRDKGLTYEQIGDKYKITAERVRQILTFVVEFCDTHKRQYIGTCSYCDTHKNYVSKIDTILDENLNKEIERLSKPSRKKEIVMQRTALIKSLKDNYKFSFRQIAKLLSRDRSSISNLYFK